MLNNILFLVVLILGSLAVLKVLYDFSLDYYQSWKARRTSRKYILSSKVEKRHAEAAPVFPFKCYDPCHGTPCPLPCEACNDECDRKTWK